MSKQLKQQEQTQIKDFIQKQNKKSYLDLWASTIIRPPRCVYDPMNLDSLLENKKQLFKEMILNQKIQEIQVYNAGLVNEDQNILQSLFETNNMKKESHNCIIYLHGSSSCRLEALELLKYIIPKNISLCTFDFAGSGISEGDQISLGFFEQEDVKVVVEYLKKSSNVQNIGLWGRSMGAATAILACRNSNDLNVLVCDSPFSSLKRICQDLAWRQYYIPCCIFSLLYCCLRRKVRQMGHFDVDNLDILSEIKKLQNANTKCMLFLSAFEDQLIPPFHVNQLYEGFKGTKDIIRFGGTHNTQRPAEVQEKVLNFFIDKFNVQQKNRVTLAAEEIEFMLSK